MGLFPSFGPPRITFFYFYYLFDRKNNNNKKLCKASSHCSEAYLLEKFKMSMFLLLFFSTSIGGTKTLTITPRSVHPSSYYSPLFRSRTIISHVFLNVTAFLTKTHTHTPAHYCNYC